MDKSAAHPKYSVFEIKKKANMIRQLAVNMAKNAGLKGAHIGPGLSIVDIVATLYFGVLKHNPQNPRWPERDRFILSKGHGVLGLYPALALAGYFAVEELEKEEEKKKENSLESSAKEKKRASKDWLFALTAIGAFALGMGIFFFLPLFISELLRIPKKLNIS